MKEKQMTYNDNPNLNVGEVVYFYSDHQVELLRCVRKEVTIVQGRRYPYNSWDQSIYLNDPTIIDERYTLVDPMGRLFTTTTNNPRDIWNKYSDGWETFKQRIMDKIK